MEAELFARVRSAREGYERAKAEASALTQLQMELGLNHPDGRGAALKASQIEKQAIQEYSRALREFTNFILQRLPGHPVGKE